jgi:hypothetical protein
MINKYIYKKGSKEKVLDLKAYLSVHPFAELPEGYVLCRFYNGLVPIEEAIKATTRNGTIMYFHKDALCDKRRIASNGWDLGIQTFIQEVGSNELVQIDNQVKIDNTYHSPENCLQDVRSGRFYLKEKLDPEKYVYFEEYNGFAFKTDLVKTKDTKRLIPRPYAYKSGDDFYEFELLARPSKGPIKFDHTKIPKEINDRRLGIELEFGDATKLSREVLRQKELRTIWSSVRDGSLDSISNGIEFVSIPLKIDELGKVEDFIKLAKKLGADANIKCGYHVHISAINTSFVDVSALVTLCTNIENELFKLFPPSRQNNNYCRKLDEIFDGFVQVTHRKNKNIGGEQLYSKHASDFKTRHQDSKYRNSNGQNGPRYYWLNLDRLYHKRANPEQRTIEFRLHEATFDHTRFVSFAILCYYLVEYSIHHGKKTCKTATLKDIISFVPYKYRKRLTHFIESPAPKEKKPKKNNKGERSFEDTSRIAGNAFDNTTFRWSRSTSATDTSPVTDSNEGLVYMLDNGTSTSNQPTPPNRTTNNNIIVDADGVGYPINRAALTQDQERIIRTEIPRYQVNVNAGPNQEPLRGMMLEYTSRRSAFIRNLSAISQSTPDSLSPTLVNTSLESLVRQAIAVSGELERVTQERLERLRRSRANMPDSSIRRRRP